MYYFSQRKYKHIIGLFLFALMAIAIHTLTYAQSIKTIWKIVDKSYEINCTEDQLGDLKVINGMATFDEQQIYEINAIYKSGKAIPIHLDCTISRHTKIKEHNKETGEYKVKVRDHIIYYVSIDTLLEYAPRTLRNEWSSFRIIADKEAETTCSVDWLKRIIIISKPTLLLYSAVGSHYYKTRNLQRNDNWRKIWSRERAYSAFGRDNPSRAEYFTRCFYLYCLDPEFLNRQSPLAYQYLSETLH